MAETIKRRRWMGFDEFLRRGEKRLDPRSIYPTDHLPYVEESISSPYIHGKQTRKLEILKNLPPRTVPSRDEIESFMATGYNVTQAQLFAYLTRNANIPCSTDELLGFTLGDEADEKEISRNISKIRKRLVLEDQPLEIISIAGIGYVLKDINPEEEEQQTA